MSSEIEIEYKSLLSKEKFLELNALFFTEKTLPFEQTNYYFDTPNFSLKEKGMGLRVRRLAERMELTLKEPLPDQTGLLETTDYLNHKADITDLTTPTTWPESEVFARLSQVFLNFSELELKAELTTRRLEKKLSPDILLVLDESWYHGQHDYELEMEVTNSQLGLDYFNTFLNTHGIHQKTTSNKIARAILAKSSL